MAKVTITIEDRAESVEIAFDDLNPGVTLKQAIENPTPAEGLAFSLIALAEKMGQLHVGRVINDAEYHAGEGDANHR